MHRLVEDASTPFVPAIGRQHKSRVSLLVIDKNGGIAYLKNQHELGEMFTMNKDRKHETNDVALRHAYQLERKRDDS